MQTENGQNLKNPKLFNFASRLSSDVFLMYFDAGNRLVMVRTADSKPFSIFGRKRVIKKCEF